MLFKPKICPDITFPLAPLSTTLKILALVYTMVYVALGI